jgi:hypothetical protein
LNAPVASRKLLLLPSRRCSAENLCVGEDSAPTLALLRASPAPVMLRKY